MTEEQIERHVEYRMDKLDKRFMREDFTQEDYDKAVKELNAWADKQYDIIAKGGL